MHIIICMHGCLFVVENCIESMAMQFKFRYVNIIMGKDHEFGTSRVGKIDISHFPPRSM